jgi:hypothetical protein
MTDPADTDESAQEPEPAAAKAYAATHRVLCAHAGDDGAGMHWLEPGETCSAARRRETAGCECTPSRCTRSEFRDHQGDSPGCMACADLDPDQPCYAAIRPAARD